MKLFKSTTLETLQDLLVEQIEDLYDAEQRLCDALPKMMESASELSLKRAFHDHLGQTVQHVQRLERVFEMLDIEPTRETCDAMKGLISECVDMIQAKGDATVRDAALIAAAQRVEHYEIASYGTACSLARHIGHSDVADILDETLDEEKLADMTLTEVAETKVNAASPKR